jgi:hypothetical protein
MAMQREYDEKRVILMPIRLDDGALQTDKYFADKLKQREIADFSGLKDEEEFNKRLNVLLRPR